MSSTLKPIKKQEHKCFFRRKLLKKNIISQLKDLDLYTHIQILKNTYLAK